MRRKMVFMGFGTALVLFGLVVFAGCKNDTVPEENSPQTLPDPVIIGNVTIINIPKTVGGGASYKVFVQIAFSSNAEDGAIALGSKVIGAEEAAIFYENSNPSTPWTADGTPHYVAVVVSPATVTKWQDIAIYAPAVPKDFSTPLTFDLATGKGLLKLNDVMPTKVPQIFNGGKGLGDQELPADQKGVICVPESGITYPSELGK
ncbi:hypothetical protein AGMMS4952_23080 [Spirochaetia bacterium]|nr:hypothetical protein AGMMS4952_23080 [Spirochaetia bacterium]